MILSRKLKISLLTTVGIFALSAVSHAEQASGPKIIRVTPDIEDQQPAKPSKKKSSNKQESKKKTEASAEQVDGDSEPTEKVVNVNAKQNSLGVITEGRAVDDSQKLRHKVSNKDLFDYLDQNYGATQPRAASSGVNVSDLPKAEPVIVEPVAADIKPASVNIEIAPEEPRVAPKENPKVSKYDEMKPLISPKLEFPAIVNLPNNSPVAIVRPASSEASVQKAPVVKPEEPIVSIENIIPQREIKQVAAPVVVNSEPAVKEPTAPAKRFVVKGFDGLEEKKSFPLPEKALKEPVTQNAAAVEKWETVPAKQQKTASKLKPVAKPEPLAHVESKPLPEPVMKTLVEQKAASELQQPVAKPEPQVQAEVKPLAEPVAKIQVEPKTASEVQQPVIKPEPVVEQKAVEADQKRYPAMNPQLIRQQRSAALEKQEVVPQSAEQASALDVNKITPPPGVENTSIEQPQKAVVQNVQDEKSVTRELNKKVLTNVQPVAPVVQEDSPVQQRREVVQSVDEDLSSKRIVRANFTSAIKGLEPVDSIDTAKGSKLYYFTEIKGLTGKKVTHRWEQEGKVLVEKEMTVGSNSWRLWSSASVNRSRGGKVKVSVLDDSGNLIKQDEIKVSN